MNHKQHSISEKHVFTRKDPRELDVKRTSANLLHRVYSLEDKIPAVNINSDTDQVLLNTIHRTLQLVVFLHFALVLLYLSSLAYYRFLHHLSFTLLSQQINPLWGYGIAGTMILACSFSLFAASNTATRPHHRAPAMQLLVVALVGISLLLAVALLLSLKPGTSATETETTNAQENQELVSANVIAEETDSIPAEEVVVSGPDEATILPRGASSPLGFTPPDPKLRQLVSEKSATAAILLPALRAYRATIVLLIVQQFFVFLVLLILSLGALRTTNKNHHIFSYFHSTNLLASISLFWMITMLLLSIL